MKNDSKDRSRSPRNECLSFDHFCLAVVQLQCSLVQLLPLCTLRTVFLQTPRGCYVLILHVFIYVTFVYMASIAQTDSKSNEIAWNRLILIQNRARQIRLSSQCRSMSILRLYVNYLSLYVFSLRLPILLYIPRSLAIDSASSRAESTPGTREGLN